MLARGFLGLDAVAGTDVTSAGQTGVWSGFFAVFADSHTWKIIWQTLWMAFAGTVLSVILGIPSAYTLYCLDFPGRRLLRGIIAIPFVLPTVVVGIAFRSLLEGPLSFLGLANSTSAVVMAMVFFNFSVIVRTVGTMWSGIDRRTAEAARTLGASPMRAFLSVTLPQLAPAIAAGAGLVFLYCSTAYGIVTTLGNPGYGTIEMEIYLQTVTFFNLDRAAILSILQFVIVVFALLVTTTLTKKTEVALRVSKDSSRPVKKADAGALVATFASVAFIATPLATLAIRSLRVNGEFSLENYRRLQTPGTGFTGGTTVFEGISHSVKIATDATLIALVVAIPLALVLSRRVNELAARFQQLLDGFVLLPLGISTVTVGFGFLITFGPTAFGRSPLLVPVAQAVVALPLAVRVLLPVLRAIDPRLREAAATLGASPAQILRTIDMPFLLRGLGLATGFSFAVSLGEFGATSFLADPAYQTLPVVIVKLLSRPGEYNYGMALAGAVILAVATASAMIAAEMLSMRRQPVPLVERKA
ncbi:thiamine transport system permease protein [Arcanobacterium pluranimalium]|uniref:ABC transporter permease n=1 Tax=Arcanobacterium pluranimalium TaxID=108028 RepID=UPI0019581FEB|nr:iron ABC transporter permease [Arcanobacterium pluranimalium]MBM7824282.1 thiamine transport system permease protein [Arcanobacterium pluranimalium]